MKQIVTSKSRQSRVSFILFFSYHPSLFLAWLFSYMFYPAGRHFAFLFPYLQFVQHTWRITRTGRVAKAALAMVKAAEELAGRVGAEPNLPSIVLQPVRLHLPVRGAGYGWEEGQPPGDTLSHSSQFADIKQLCGVVVLTLSHLLLS